MESKSKVAEYESMPRWRSVVRNVCAKRNLIKRTLQDCPCPVATYNST